MMQLVEQGNALLAAAVLEKSQELDKLISAYLQRKCLSAAVIFFIKINTAGKRHLSCCIPPPHFFLLR